MLRFDKVTLPTGRRFSEELSFFVRVAAGGTLTDTGPRQQVSTVRRLAREACTRG